MGARDRIEILDGLRGFAALWVAWFHFTHGSGLFHAGPVLASGNYGWLGVEIFFVISGFVIPYSMLNGGYRGLEDAGAFMLKRIVRLDPPYITAVLLCLALLYLSAAAPGFKGPSPHVTVGQILLHLGYLNAFAGRPWLNPVFWTLAIEFQFYLAMVVLFPLLAGRAIHRGLGLCLMAALALALPQSNLLFHFLGLFAVGAAAFHYRMRLTPAAWTIVAMSALSIVNGVALGLPAALAGLVAGMLAAFANPPRLRVLSWLGAISYSLYLLHVPIGGRVMNLAGRLPEAWHAPALAVALGVSLVSAYAFYRLIELPSQRLSKHVSYRRRPAPASGLAEAA
jgi:peptidoglycan/LPS O-acetylase OafA/YrhL